MTLGTRDGWLWPAQDEHLWACAFDYTILKMAMEHTTTRRSVIQAGGACGTFPNWLSQGFERVYTFEPDPENFTCLAANCQQKNVIKFQCALGAEARGVSLSNDKPSNAGMHHIGSGDDVRMLAGDDLELTDVDLIQLDVEGAEFMALHGLTRTIERSHPVVVIEQKLSERYGVTPEQVIDYLASLHYQQVGSYARDLIFKRKS